MQPIINGISNAKKRLNVIQFMHFFELSSHFNLSIILVINRTANVKEKNTEVTNKGGGGGGWVFLSKCAKHEKQKMATPECGVLETGYYIWHSVWALSLRERETF
jgi:hypothetical protein